MQPYLCTLGGVFWIIVLLEEEECVPTVLVVVIERNQPALKDRHVLHCIHHALHANELTHTMQMNCAPHIDLDIEVPVTFLRLDCVLGEEVLAVPSPTPLFPIQ